ncbi:hypothetical protein [Microcystis aeruginosa]|uniref:hypothetical protein n=1 Tax=Microcystis aeruginosa TaxID=1126 RepID=UPI00187EB406|nr:hypothetical protein [Microcystis aeruginosa]MBE8994470.1 hypothetical protein [Microcystis aeruginosa LEGE 91341]
MSNYQFVSVTCITPSTGVSGIATGVITAISSTLGGAIAGSLAALTGPGAVFAGTAGSVAGTLVGKGAGSLLESLGQMLPDNLYIEVDGKKVWPSGKYQNINAGDKITPSVRGAFGHPTGVTLEEWDVFGDDNLGEFVISPTQKGNGFAYLVANPKEGDVYEVVLNIS